MTERSQIVGLLFLVGIFLLKDFIIPPDKEESNGTAAKEIPSLHLDRFSGPSMKFVFW